MNELDDDLPRDPGQDVLGQRMRAQHAVDHGEHVGRGALGHQAVAMEDRLVGAGLGRDLPREDVAEQVDRLQVAALPAEIGIRHRRRALFAQMTRHDELRRGDIHGRWRARRREVMRARRGAARHLQVEKCLAVAETVIVHQSLADALQGVHTSTR